jgi:hypothetical protein
MILELFNFWVPVHPYQDCITFYHTPNRLKKVESWSGSWKVHQFFITDAEGPALFASYFIERHILFGYFCMIMKFPRHLVNGFNRFVYKYRCKQLRMYSAGIMALFVPFRDRKLVAFAIHLSCKACRRYAISCVRHQYEFWIMVMGAAYCVPTARRLIVIIIFLSIFSPQREHHLIYLIMSNACIPHNTNVFLNQSLAKNAPLHIFLFIFWVLARPGWGVWQNILYLSV